MKVRVRHLFAFAFISLLSLCSLAAEASAQNGVLSLLSASPKLPAKSEAHSETQTGTDTQTKSGEVTIAITPSSYTYSVLYSFCPVSGCADGQYPEAGLLQDSAGNLYGTTYAGGEANSKCAFDTCGTVFKLTTSGQESVLYDFCSASNCTDGNQPQAVLIRDSAGNLYGTTAYGGAGVVANGGGTVFKVGTTDQETVLYSFCPVLECTDGYYIVAGLMEDTSGNLYGTAGFGGVKGHGAVFKVNTSDSESDLYSFCSVTNCTDGSGPYGGVISDSAGNLYGTTIGGGANCISNGGCGTVFKIDTTGKETVLYSFCSVGGTSCTDGEYPYAGLIRDAAGNLYGTTAQGGNSGCYLGCGTVFKVDTTGKETVLHAFCSASGCTDGATPYAGLVQDAAGNLYGTTDVGGAVGQGSVFKIDTSGNETVLYSFCSVDYPSCTDGQYTFSSLILDSAGDLYGTTQKGGANGYGTVFKLAAPSGGGSGIITFEAPDAGTGALQGTAGLSINTAGVITGEYTDANYVYHGFVRAANGTITEFDASGAGTGVYQGTFPSSINTKGTIAGTYTDSGKAYHGFLRATGGAITEFNVSGAGTAGHQGTFPIGINTGGVIAGGFKDSGNVYHGFTRTSKGTFTTFDAPGAGTAAHEGTIAIGINTAGTIIGTYIDANGLHNGFVRATSGTITTFDGPGATAHLGTVPLGINTKGTIAGTYTDTNGSYHGFVRATNGTLTSFDAPSAGTAAGQGTVGVSINTAGTITGTYADAETVYHGFVRTASGTVTSFDAPGAGPNGSLIALVAKAMAMPQGTAGLSINTAGAITGAFTDANDVYHGFLLPVLTATKTALTSAPNPSTDGETVTFTATVTPAPPDGETVSFMKGETVLGTETLNGGSASFATSTLKVGTTSVIAVYSGDLTYGGSKSAADKQVVEKGVKE
jgi:uncharacterized repeat protein (TIGR03803 family)